MLMYHMEKDLRFDSCRNVSLVISHPNNFFKERYVFIFRKVKTYVNT